ncbi:MAG: pyruvate kinase [Bacteroidota bacterium]
MKVKAQKIRLLIEQLEEIRTEVLEGVNVHEDKIAAVCPTYHDSARNLLHYRALRTKDLRDIQKQLGNLGMSRLANAEGHLMASLHNTLYILHRLLEESPPKRKRPSLSIKKSHRALARHTKALLGYRSKGRRVRIMVTQPTESAYNYKLVEQMVKDGMNCARVNCAHDSPEVWLQIIQNVRKAAQSQRRKVKIAMDLAGPKIRTGALAPGPKVRKCRPQRDETGNIIRPAIIHLVKEVVETDPRETFPVAPAVLQLLEPGDELSLIDTRQKSRRMKVVEKQSDRVLLHAYETCYLATDLSIQTQRQDLPHFVLGDVTPLERSIILREGDTLLIHKDPKLGEPAVIDEDGKVLEEAHVSCQLPAVFAKVSVGEEVLFDDGKIGGVIIDSNKEYFRVKIVRAKITGAKLKAEKGINFPTTDLGISGLTEKDRQDLSFVVKHADVVNFSFVNSAEDVEDLLEEFRKHDAMNKLSIILKIETRRAYNNLTEILLAAMQTRYIGVMIARGDLAVETGWDQIGMVQKELVLKCNAAHIPVVWATQVLEGLAKKGLPSRSEITDVVNAIQAECVMLNKGLYINDAIRLLSKILEDTEQYSSKKEVLLPKQAQLEV